MFCISQGCEAPLPTDSNAIAVCFSAPLTKEPIPLQWTHKTLIRTI